MRVRACVSHTRRVCIRHLQDVTLAGFAAKLSLRVQDVQQEHRRLLLQCVQADELARALEAFSSILEGRLIGANEEGAAGETCCPMLATG